MNPIPFPTVQALYSPGIVEMSIIRNLHCFLIIVLVLLLELELLLSPPPLLERLTSNTLSKET